MGDQNDLAKRLAGLTLAEAFDKIIGADPELRELAKNAVDASPGNPYFPDYPGNPYLPNLETRSYGEVADKWPVLTEDLRTMESHWGTDLTPDATEADAKYMKGIADRYDLMMEPVRAGCLLGQGHLRDGTIATINKGIWSNDSYLIDFVHSDVGKISEIEGFETFSRFTPVWSAVELILPSKVTGEKDAVAKSPNELKLTPSEQAIFEAHLELFPDDVPVGRRIKERNSAINQWLIKNGHSRVSCKTIQRFYAKWRRASN